MRVTESVTHTYTQREGMSQAKSTAVSTRSGGAKKAGVEGATAQRPSAAAAAASAASAASVGAGGVAAASRDEEGGEDEEKVRHGDNALDQPDGDGEDGDGADAARADDEAGGGEEARDSEQRESRRELEEKLQQAMRDMERMSGHAKLLEAILYLATHCIYAQTYYMTQVSAARDVVGLTHIAGLLSHSSVHSFMERMTHVELMLEAVSVSEQHRGEERCGVCGLSSVARQ